MWREIIPTGSWNLGQSPSLMMKKMYITELNDLPFETKKGMFSSCHWCWIILLNIIANSSMTALMWPCKLAAAKHQWHLDYLGQNALHHLTLTFRLYAGAPRNRGQMPGVAISVSEWVKHTINHSKQVSAKGSLQDAMGKEWHCPWSARAVFSALDSTRMICICFCLLPWSLLCGIYRGPHIPISHQTEHS